MDQKGFHLRNAVCFLRDSDSLLGLSFILDEYAAGHALRESDGALFRIQCEFTLACNGRDFILVTECIVLIDDLYVFYLRTCGSYRNIFQYGSAIGADRNRLGYRNDDLVVCCCDLFLGAELRSGKIKGEQAVSEVKGTCLGIVEGCDLGSEGIGHSGSFRGKFQARGLDLGIAAGQLSGCGIIFLNGSDFFKY